MRNVAALMAVIPLPKSTVGGTCQAPREGIKLGCQKVKLTDAQFRTAACPKNTQQPYGVKDPFQPGLEELEAHMDPPQSRYPLQYQGGDRSLSFQQRLGAPHQSPSLNFRQRLGTPQLDPDFERQAPPRRQALHRGRLLVQPHHCH